MPTKIIALLFLVTLGLEGIVSSTASADIITGVGSGGGSHVKVFSSTGGSELASFFAYGQAFTGGVRVATGDVTGDGVADIVTGAGPGGGAHIKVYDGKSGDVAKNFIVLIPSYPGGIYVAAGDVDDDGRADIVTGSGEGGLSQVSIYHATNSSLLLSYTPYGTAFTGGVRVATGDVDGDGSVDVITGAGPGGGPHVKVFSGSTGQELDSFFAYDPGFLGGIYVAAGDVNGDQIDDIITGAGGGSGGHVKVFDGQTGSEIRSFFAFDPGFSGGVRVAAGDVNGDGLADIITGAGPGAGPHVKVFDGQTGSEIQSFFAYPPAVDQGIYVAYRASTVPEPATLTLAAGVAGVAFVLVKRRRQR